MSSNENAARSKDSTDKSLNNSTAALEITPGNTFKMTKFQIIKNVFVVSFGFLFLFTSFQSLSNLQSSLNREQGLGMIGLSVIYASLVISCMFLTPVKIARLGCKWTIAISMLCYVVYMLANMYAIRGTIIAASIILGLGAAPLWSAKCTYLTQAGVWYAQMTGTTKDIAITLFFGSFFMIFQTSQIWGNLISTMVFGHISVNSTHVSYEGLLKCGANYDPAVGFNNTNLARPDMDKIYTVCGIYIASAGVGFLIIVIFLDRIVMDNEKVAGNDKKISPHLLVETFKHCWRSHYQKLIVPLTIYSGIEQAFIAGDFTVVYISPTRQYNCFFELSMLLLQDKLLI